MIRLGSSAVLRRRVLGILIAVLSASGARAQGTDSCTTPTLVTGAGPHAFNNASATNGAQSSVCSVTCAKDVWFRWTAPTTGTYTLSLCGLTTIDSVVAVYAGTGCPAAAAIACNDDSCSLQSSIAFSATSGSSYVFQIGSFGTTAGGSGTFTVSIPPPPPPCSAAVGPDVIVGDVTGPSNYAAASGIDAIALGTTSCNLGDTWLNWFSSTNQHPVIGGNLYRYKVVGGAGRFEQIGMSWLKHGFFALSQTLCCTTCVSTDGTHLGVGCSDPYTSTRNGTQSGLGPRWQVNANTGAFTYPPANPSWAGSTARRLEFLLTDVEATPGVRYFGESQYVTPDDAIAGNQDNNASWRELLVSGSATDWTFALSGSTTRQQSAVQAWALCESGVTLTNVDLPSEGRLILGHKVTALGGGQYRYEYALYNMNSDDAVRSFALPIGAGVTVTNAGFHDLPYRNGDGPGNVNYDGADWTSSNSGGVLSWSTQTFAQNASANALRWGSTYNFRFDANVAPTGGTITLGRYKSAGSATVAAAVPGSAGPDSDGDGVTDAVDNCPSVANTNQANADGDASGDACDTCTDTDGDGFANPGFPASTCPVDGCPNDPLKSAPGACGCGVPETDSDGDGTPNCVDGCPNDPLKITPGPCGCGVPNTDSDGDGTPNCNDGCPNDPLKTTPGACGCGVPNTDSDGDGTPNCVDGCPNDPLKITPGACGCGVPNTDSDNDGTPNCIDGCPNDPAKIAPGVCGCGVADTDSDNDGTPNCNDGCPNDPLKTTPGACGCGVPNTDSDGDGTPNCNDGCPNDPLKITPGACGCGVPNTDSDNDGTPNCIDGCPNDPAKIAPGVCGCGVADTDSDG
ncbi:MAG: thrombospondin type 3 repeat-containing protein, partial [Planctomycetota bacterium]|nr:thrombospondin type 3 repeat-containing protein [Planctomycetota bacterium]